MEKKIRCILWAFLALFYGTTYAQKTDAEYVYSKIKKATIHSEIAFAICMLESGNLDSRLAKKQHNIFGMQHPKKRVTLSIKEEKGYALYLSKDAAIADYAIFEMETIRKKGLNDEYAYWVYICDNYKSDKMHPEDYATLLLKQMLYNRKRYSFVEQNSSLIFKQ